MRKVSNKEAEVTQPEGEESLICMNVSVYRIMLQ